MQLSFVCSLCLSMTFLVWEFAVCETDWVVHVVLISQIDLFLISKRALTRDCSVLATRNHWNSKKKERKKERGILWATLVHWYAGCWGLKLHITYLVVTSRSSLLSRTWNSYPAHFDCSKYELSKCTRSEHIFPRQTIHVNPSTSWW